MSSAATIFDMLFKILKFAKSVNRGIGPSDVMMVANCSHRTANRYLSDLKDLGYLQLLHKDDVRSGFRPTDKCEV